MSDPVTLRVEKPIYGGAGLARHDGRAIFTPFTLPGELVTATVTHSKSSFAEASLLALLEPSPARTVPHCPYFGACGGCHYQHATYPAQLEMKRAILAETLTRSGLRDLPEIVTLSGEPFSYRNRIRLHLDPVNSAVGYRERGSHRLLAINHCPIAAPELEYAMQIFSAVCVKLQSGHIFSELELSVNHDGSELLAAFWLRSRDSSGRIQEHSLGEVLEQFCELAQSSIPSLRGAGIHGPQEPPASDRHRRNLLFGQRAQSERSQSRTSRLAGRGRFPSNRSEGDGTVDGSALRDDSGAMLANWGTPQMNYRVAGLDYRVSLGAFFQVNRSLVEQLVASATIGRKGALAWDLYAGVGLFSRVLGRHFHKVVAVEGAPVSYQDLRVNLGQPHEAVRISTLEFLRRQTQTASRSHVGAVARRKTQPGAIDSARPDFVLVDPPRAGLGADVTTLLAQIGPPHITYVSCDPATLARDLRTLIESGYKLEQLQLIDLFPQTFHLESVATLSLS